MLQSKKAETIKQLSDLKLEATIARVVKSKESFNSMKKVVWGAGVSGKNFIRIHSDMAFSYIVDTREELQRKDFMGLSVVSPEVLYKEDKDSTLVFVPSVIHKELTTVLREKGFKHIIVPNQFNTSGVGFSINKSDITNIFCWLNSNGINYVYLKCLPEDLSRLKDIDIMISTEDVGKLLSCEYLINQQEIDSTYLDVSWSAPLGINAELPFYTKSLSDAILKEENSLLIDGIRALKPQMLLYTFVFHALIHKGTPEAVEKYRSVLIELQEKVNIKFEITLEGMWSFLSETNYFPQLDLTRKWAECNGSEFLKNKTRRENRKVIDDVVFVFREFFQERTALLMDVINLIIKDGYTLQRLVYLSEETKEYLTDNMRGGVWEDSYQSKRAGGPYVVGVFRGDCIAARKTKENIRIYVNEVNKEEVNCIHSSDDGYEAEEYIRLMDK